uniref:6,7-dimethyl-8-ribityllumazine synthase n=1 Tax=Erythrolobus australicus TaxID=1077150 RepID=A0A7S1XGX3_9RHOD
MVCGFVGAGGASVGQSGAVAVRSRCEPGSRVTVGGWRRARGALAMAKEVSFDELDGSTLRIGIVRSRWNAEMIEAMRKDVRQTLLDSKVPEANIVEVSVPGSWELPLAARYMSITQKLDAIIVLGVLVKGETTHFEAIADSVCRGLMDLQMSSIVPVVLGVLTCLSEEQAAARSTGSKSHAADWAMTAIEMGLLRASQMGKTAGSSAAAKLVGFGMLSDVTGVPTPKEAPEPSKKIGF